MFCLQSRALRGPVTGRIRANYARYSVTAPSPQSAPSTPPASEPANTTEAPSKPRSSPPRKVIFSGIQPTGIPHLGNYLGALRHWVKLQNGSSKKRTTLLFSVVDLHAITVKQERETLRTWRKEMLASLMAVGLEPAKSLMFCQSTVPQHAEMMWILSCTASMGYLSRMTQWKSKLSLPADANPLDMSDAKSREALKLGLFSYPVLQAADILLYGTTHVPVGEDQAQHLEFTRRLAYGFNHAHHAVNTREAKPGTKAPPLLIPPETILSPAKRVMSLTNPTKKMSKSDPNPKSRILITDTKEEIDGKVSSALTDSIEGISYDREARPGVSNLIDLMFYMDESVAATPADLAKDMEQLSMRALKEKVAESVNAKIAPVRERYHQIISADAQKSFLNEYSEESARRARKLAKDRLRMVKKAVGLGAI